MTITTTVGHLRRVLRLATLFADDPDVGHPELATVYLEAGGGVITATATDRYTLGHARADADGHLPDGGIIIPARMATWLAAGLGEGAGQDEVVVDATGVDGSRLRIATPDLTATVPTARPLTGPGTDGLTRGAWIDYRRIVADYCGEPAAVQPVIAPRVLAVLARVADVLPGVAGRWTISGPHQPIRYDVGDTLVALIMPARAAAEQEQQWPIPVGLPEPAATGTDVRP